MAAWEVNVTDEVATWYRGLSEAEADAIEARVDLLEHRGPDLKRPVVGQVVGSEFDPQMKELRASVGRADLRALFMFDPRRQVILLVGGDKQSNWRHWYGEAIPVADRLYREYLEELREMGETD